jgi:hypothetical protein
MQPKKEDNRKLPKNETPRTANEKQLLTRDKVGQNWSKPEGKPILLDTDLPEETGSPRYVRQ